MKIQIYALVLASMAAITSCDNSADSKTITEVKDSVTVTPEKMENRTSVKTVEVTPVIKTKFTEKYPAATKVEWTKYDAQAPIIIDWELTGWPQPDSMDYIANYNIDNADYWTWYTPEGDWVATVSTINVANVPDAVNKTLRSQFEGYTVTSVNKENDKNRTAYEIKMEKGEDKMKALIDEKGNIMKKKGKENGEKIKEKNT